jgi:rhodanese-related sulfurtransferase
MAAKRTSTIGYEKKYNYALRISDRQAFIRALTSDMPAAPDHFARCSAINRAGPALMQSLLPPVPIEPKPFFDRIRGGNALILDVRSYQAFSGVHIPGAWHIDLSGNFPTQAGWILPHDRDILIVVEERRHAEEAALQLHRVGFDRIAGFLEGGMLYWGSAGLPISRVPVLCPDEVHTLVGSGGAVLVDVRSKKEWEDAHADGSIHIPWHDLRTRHTELDPSLHYILMCKGGQRASIGASILKMHGFSNVSNLGGGYTAYKRAGYAP